MKLASSRFSTTVLSISEDFYAQHSHRPRGVLIMRVRGTRISRITVSSAHIFKVTHRCHSPSCVRYCPVLASDIWRMYWSIMPGQDCNNMFVRRRSLGISSPLELAISVVSSLFNSTTSPYLYITAYSYLSIFIRFTFILRYPIVFLVFLSFHAVRNLHSLNARCPHVPIPATC